MEVQNHTHITQYDIGRFDGQDFKSLKEMTREELINIAELLQERLLVKTTELNSVVLTMNKFLCKDHPEQFQKLLESAGQTSRY